MVGVKGGGRRGEEERDGGVRDEVERELEGGRGGWKLGGCGKWVRGRAEGGEGGGGER